MNKRTVVWVGAVTLVAAFCADGARVPAKFGDVTLQGPVGDRLERMIRNHVVANHPVYLAECFRTVRDPAEILPKAGVRH